MRRSRCKKYITDSSTTRRNSQYSCCPDLRVRKIATVENPIERSLVLWCMATEAQAGSTIYE